MAGTALTTYSSTLPLTGGFCPSKSLDAYIHFANTVPVLTEAEEQEYAQRLKQHNDLQAAQKLIMSHLRFVIKIARGLSGYGLQLADLIQEGNIGLMKAVKRFDPTVGVRLVSFAVHWIKAEMHEFIIKNWRIVKVATTKAQRKLFFNLRNAKKRLGWFTQEEIQDVATTLNVKPSEVMEMEQRLNAHDEAFDAPEADDDLSCFAPSHYLTNDEAEMADALDAQKQSDQQQQALKQALAKLDKRSQEILNARWLSETKTTLQDLAKKYDVSAERIRQIENRAMAQIRQFLAA